MVGGQRRDYDRNAAQGLPGVTWVPGGGWRMWYDNEPDGRTIYYADSPDLVHLTDRGLAVRQGGEGPKVFRSCGAWWMIVDVWHGLAVFRSDGALTWHQQAATLLEQPGHGADDGVMGGRAYLFYFVHPGRQGLDAKRDGPGQRRNLIQVTELVEEGGVVRTDRDAPVRIRLGPAM